MVAQIYSSVCAVSLVYMLFIVENFVRLQRYVSKELSLYCEDVIIRIVCF